MDGKVLAQRVENRLGDLLWACGDHKPASAFVAFAYETCDDNSGTIALSSLSTTTREGIFGLADNAASYAREIGQNIVGFGVACDASHVVQPEHEGAWAIFASASDLTGFAVLALARDNEGCDDLHHAFMAEGELPAALASLSLEMWTYLDGLGVAVMASPDQDDAVNLA